MLKSRVIRDFPSPGQYNRAGPTPGYLQANKTLFPAVLALGSKLCARILPGSRVHGISCTIRTVTFEWLVTYWPWMTTLLRSETYYNKVDYAWQRKYAYCHLYGKQLCCKIVCSHRCLYILYIAHKMVKYEESGDASHSDMTIDELSLQGRLITGDQNTSCKRESSKGNANTARTQKLSHWAWKLVKQLAVQITS